jgi:integrase
MKVDRPCNRALIKHREFNDHPIEVVAQYFTSLQWHCNLRSVCAPSLLSSSIISARLGKAAEMPFAVHPHMLRHACGFKLANDGHDTRALQHYLGHKNIQHTVR